MTQQKDKSPTHIDALNAYQHFDTNAQNLYFESSNLDLNIKTKTSETLLHLVQDSNVQTIILTGDAGHGKTHLCGVLLASLTKETLLQAAQQLKEGDQGITEIKDVLPDGRGIRFVKDLSDGQVDDLQNIFKTAISDTQYLTIICANDGILRNTCNGADDLTHIVKLLDDSVLEGKNERGKTSPSKSKPPKRCSKQRQRNISQSSLKQWVEDDEKWADCEGCQVADQCPILENRNQIRHNGITADNERVTGIEILLRTIEQLGVTITIRDMLFYLSYLITGSLSCEDVHQMASKEADNTWQWQYLFQQIAFASNLDEEKREKSNVLFTVRKLDPGQRAVREVDDQFSDTKREYGRFPPLAFQRRTESNEASDDYLLQSDCWRFLRRKYFFDELAGSTKTVQVEKRMGLSYVSDFQSIINGTVEQETERIKTDLIKGLEAVQGVNRETPSTFLLVHPALAGHPSSATIIHKTLMFDDLCLEPRKSVWAKRKQNTNDENDISTSIDWAERSIVICFDGGDFKNKTSINLFLHEFEYLISSGKGLRSALFFAAEKDRFLGRLERIGEFTGSDNAWIEISYGDETKRFIHRADKLVEL